MPSLAQLYATEIRRHLGGYHATWLPDTSLRLGDVGILQDGVFVRQGDLSHFGIEFAARPDSTPSRLDYTASNNVQVTFKASGESNTALPGLPVAQAGVGFAFVRAGEFALRAEEAYEPTIDDLFDLQRQLRARLRRGDWQGNYLVVTGVVQTPVLTLIIAKSDGAKVELSVEGTLTPAVPALGKAGIGLGVVRQSGGVLKLDPGLDVTPFVRLHRMTPQLFGDRTLKPLSLMSRSPRAALSAPAADLAARRRDANAHFLAPVLGDED